MKVLKQYGVIVAFFLLFIVSAIMDPGNFLRPENLLLLVRQNVDIGLIAVGMTIVIVAGGIDLSVGALMTLAAAVGLTALNQQGPAGGAAAVAIASVVTVGLGTVLGLINGLLVTMGRLAPFVATLCGLVAFRSLALVIGPGPAPCQRRPQPGRQSQAHLGDDDLHWDGGNRAHPAGAHGPRAQLGGCGQQREGFPLRGLASGQAQDAFVRVTRAMFRAGGAHLCFAAQ